MIYIDNLSTDPFFNFALERYLMEEKNLDDDVFMFWRTSPTLMIGKYQNPTEEINEQFVREQGINVVRRITGGGTIYTDMGGWQFSFITRGEEGQIDFKTFVTPIIEALRSLDVSAEFNSRNDLVIGGRKFSGNAQCIKSGCTLHHGSILFNTDLNQMVRCLSVDDYKIISKGIKSVRERVTNISEHMTDVLDPDVFKALMVDHIRKGSTKEYVLIDKDKERIEKIADKSFRTWEWNYGKAPLFNITKTGRFDGGKMEFRLDVEKGVILSCGVYGDFFGTLDIDEFCKTLVGCRYEKESIRVRLQDWDLSKAFYQIDQAELLDLIC